jgi:hypothetical protein
LRLIDFLTKGRPFLAIAGALLTTALTAAAFGEPPQCAFTPISESRYDLRIGSRKIAIVGWGHLSANPNTSKALNGILYASEALALKKDCEGAAGRLREILVRSYSHLIDAVQSREALAAVEASFHPDWMATEFGPEEWNNRLKVMDSQNSFFDSMAKACPAETANVTQTLRLIYPGPDYNYLVASEPRIKSFGLEDPKLKAAALKVAEEIKFRHEPNLDTEPKKILAQALADLSAGKIKEALTGLNAALSAQKPGTERDELAKWVDYYQRLISFSGPRNQAMAKNIMNTVGNGVVPVGSSHARDLAEQTYALCQRASAQGLSPEGRAPDPVISAEDAH